MDIEQVFENAESAITDVYLYMKYFDMSDLKILRTPFDGDTC